jgi:hypothetical protein
VEPFPCLSGRTTTVAAKATVSLSARNCFLEPAGERSVTRALQQQTGWILHTNKALNAVRTAMSHLMFWTVHKTATRSIKPYTKLIIFSYTVENIAWDLRKCSVCPYALYDRLWHTHNPSGKYNSTMGRTRHNLRHCVPDIRLPPQVHDKGVFPATARRVSEHPSSRIRT